MCHRAVSKDTSLGFVFLQIGKTMETWIDRNSAFSAKGFRGHRLLRRQRTANVLGYEFIKFWGVVISVVLSLGKAVEKK